MLTYIDSSVVLAHLFREPRSPAASFWIRPKVSSTLLEYEVWNRLHAHHRADTHGSLADDLLRGITLLELSSAALSRALEPFPVPVRTLDGLHLSAIEFLRRCGEEVDLASYDNRMLSAAQALGIPIMPL